MLPTENIIKKYIQLLLLKKCPSVVIVITGRLKKCIYSDYLHITSLLTTKLQIGSANKRL